MVARGRLDDGQDGARPEQEPGQILYRFHARDAHLVMGPSRPQVAIPFRVTIDSQLPGTAHGVDVDEGGNGTLREQRLPTDTRVPSIPSSNRFGSVHLV
jgi:hypothetical protein